MLKTRRHQSEGFINEKKIHVIKIDILSKDFQAQNLTSTALANHSRPNSCHYKFVAIPYISYNCAHSTSYNGHVLLRRVKNLIVTCDCLPFAPVFLPI